MKRIQRKRTRGWRKPTHAVNAARPSFWGNPFLTAEEFADWLAGDAHQEVEPERREEMLRRLKAGELPKVLMCWCTENAGRDGVPACHADASTTRAHCDDPGAASCAEPASAEEGHAMTPLERLRFILSHRLDCQFAWQRLAALGTWPELVPLDPVRLREAADAAEVDSELLARAAHDLRELAREVEGGAG